MAAWDAAGSGGAGRRRTPWWVRWAAFVMGAGALSWGLAAVAREGVGDGGSGRAEGAAAPVLTGPASERRPPGADFAPWAPGRSDDLVGAFDPEELDRDEALWEHEDDDGYLWRGQATPARTIRRPDARTRRS